MEILRTVADLQRLEALRSPGPLVLVPTMGALHEGHLSLVREGVRRGPAVVSIFVNPTQFGPDEDFEAYPRNIESDLELLEPLGVRAVFAPEIPVMYGRKDGVTVAPGHRAKGLCGESRPGHFRGVLTIVAKLFGLVRPDIAVFGRKDAQQFLVIAQMVEDLKMPVQVVDLPTVREPDGLAMSSRNRYLVAGDRKRALALVTALNRARRMVEDGERTAQAIEAVLVRELATTDRPEYGVVRSVPDLERPDEIEGRILLAVAAGVGSARLIDNLVLQVDERGVEETGLIDNRPAKEP